MRQSVQVVSEALAVILDREAPLSGDRLPSERELARQLGCSRQTLRSALARAEAAGELWRHVGQGTFRGRPPPGHVLREPVLMAATSPEDLMDARLLLEPQVAGAAARRADAADIAHLHRCVAEGRAARDRGTCEIADSAFHRAVAVAGKNPVLIGVLAYLADARRRAAWQREWDRTYRRIGVGEFANGHSDQHSAVVVAIASRDAEAAEAAMRHHLETIRKALRG